MVRYSVGSALMCAAALLAPPVFAQSTAPSTTDARAALPPVNLFARCYAHLTRMQLPRNHPLRAQVASGQLSAKAACMKVFDGALLNTDGLLSTDTAESRAVAATFDNFHRSWFGNEDTEGALFQMQTGGVGTSDVQ